MTAFFCKSPRLAILAATAVLLAAIGSGCASSPDDDYADRMAAEHADDRPVPSGAAGDEPLPDVETETVVYADIDGRPVQGFLAKAAGGAEGAPGIIVIQEWWGLNDNIRDMARRLAAAGYNALAVDLYRGEVADDPDRARALMQSTMDREEELESNLRQAYGYLVDDLGTPAVGTIGWCFGGGWSLRAALLLPDEIDATVIYYGRLVDDPERLKTLQMPILGIFGEKDRGIPVDGVRAFESTLRELGKDATIQVYEGADHAFANPSGTRYDAAAAEDAWSKTLAFFDQHLRP